MNHRLTQGVSFILTIGLGLSTAAAGTGPDVTVTCLELSSENKAQIEAWVRANLIGAGPTPTTVLVSCDANSVQTQVAGNGHQTTLRTVRDETALQEALLASAEGALSAWGAPTSRATPTSERFAVLAAPPRPEPADVPIAVPSARPTPLVKCSPTGRPQARSAPVSSWLSMGLRAELWSGGSGLGAHLGLQQKIASAFAAIHTGYLLVLPPSSQFSAQEWQFGAEVGWQPPGFLGLRGALGLGLSLLDVRPAAGVSVQNGSTGSTLPCLSVELSRPVEFGALAVLPAVGVRAFRRSRSVILDGQPAFAVPAVVPEASLSMALRFGG